MLWLALKLRREFQNPCIIVLTDRRELDKQMADNFRRHGYPSPIHVERIAQLRGELRQPVGKTLIVTLQKIGSKLLQETTETEHLTEEENIFVIADEAHRGQYAVLAARMRSLLPKATFFAFTGTPLEREDKNTPQVFGSYVDRYTIMDALKDKVTVPILYQPRLPELHLSGEVDIDELLAAYFRDFGEEEEERDLREKLRRLKLTPTQVAQVGERMQKIAKDIVEHFLSEVEPRGFKAMVAGGRWLRNTRSWWTKFWRAKGAVTLKPMWSSLCSKMRTGQDHIREPLKKSSS
jgi:type I restriction enzyme R subunit